MSRIRPVVEGPGAGPTGWRATKWRLTVLAFAMVLGPAVVAYWLLTAVGLGGPVAGLTGLFLVLVGTFAYPAWLYGGGHRRSAGDGR